MVRAVLSSLTILALASTSLAQGVSKSNVKKPKANATSVSAQGIRVAFVKPILDLKLKVSDQSGTENWSEKIDDSNGISIGYAYLPIQQLGFTGNLSFISLKEESQHISSLIRAEGNLAYAATETVNFKGGLNISNFNNKEVRKAVRADVGVQASAGFQISPNFGIDLGYVMTRQRTKKSFEDSEGLKIAYEQSGPELSLSGTF